MALDPSIRSTTNTLIERMSDPLVETSKTKMLREIADRIGGLSSPSKMPGYAWSIPASRCITGSKLAQIEGTACSLCYACKGRYAFPNVQTALENRMAGWQTDPDWTLLMAVAILLHKDEPGCDYFRWFDSGDLQSKQMFRDICEVANLTDGIAHWLPTQERSFVDWTIPPMNLTVRISATKLNGAPNPIHPSSSVVTDHHLRTYEGIYLCPSRQQNNQCGQCRACWDATVGHVSYVAH